MLVRREARRLLSRWWATSSTADGLDRVSPTIFMCAACLQGGKEAVEQVVGYKQHI
jgi:hypothetical protein